HWGSERQEPRCEHTLQAWRQRPGACRKHRPEARNYRAIDPPNGGEPPSSFSRSALVANYPTLNCAKVILDFRRRVARCRPAPATAAHWHHSPARDIPASGDGPSLGIVRSAIDRI